MKVVIDTNIAVDTLGARQPHFEQSKAVMQLAAGGGIEGAITANTITDIAYLLRKHIEANSIKPALLGLMEMLDILEVNADLCYKAFDIPMSDFEDALLAACANHWKADYIVTHNVKDFTGSPVKALAPEVFLEQYREE